MSLGTIVQRTAKTSLHVGKTVLNEGRYALSMTLNGVAHVLLNGKSKPFFPKRETIILIHGIANIGGAMNPLEKLIESKFEEVFNVVFVGYRSSPSYSWMEQQVYAQLDQIYAMAQREIILTGYSLGANFAVDYSKRELKKTKEVIGIAPATNGARISHLIPKWFPEMIIPEVAARTRKDSKDIAEFHPDKLPSENNYFFIRAEKDWIVFGSRGRNGQYRNVSYLIVNDVNHWSLLESPQCLGAIEERLKRSLNETSRLI